MANYLEDKYVYVKAASVGDLELLKTIKSCNAIMFGILLGCAANGGHIEILQWLEKPGFPLDKSICDLPELEEYMKTFKTAKACNAILFGTLCDCALEGGHTKVFLWLREKGFPWVGY